MSTSKAFLFNEPQEEFEAHYALFLAMMDQPAWKKLAAFPIRFNISSLAKCLPCIFHYSVIFLLTKVLFLTTTRLQMECKFYSIFQKCHYQGETERQKTNFRVTKEKVIT